MKKGFIYLFLFVFVFLISNVSAAVCPNGEASACFYVRAGASGTGSDWNNAYSTLPTNLQRGAIYYIADGIYPEYVFTTPASGTLYINITKATANNHGTDTGWFSTYGDGRATLGKLGFLSNTANAGYVSIDGYSSTAPGNMGFEIGPLGIQEQAIVFWSAPDNWPRVTFRYMHLIGPMANGVGQPSSSGPPWSYGLLIYAAPIVSDMLISHVHFDGFATSIQDGGSTTRMTVEYSEFSDSLVGLPDHGNIYWIASDFGVFKYNKIYNWNAEGLFFGSGSGNWDVYGNVFYDGDGGVGAKSITLRLGAYNGIHIYGNTFDNILNTVFNIDTEVTSLTDIQVRNNLVYNSGNIQTGAGVTSSNNIQATAADFVSLINHDYHLTRATSSGNILSSPYNYDMDGKLRGGDGTWDIGAYEYSAPVVCTTCRYVRQGATGTGNGSDWTNAYTTLPATLTRGYTYYIADGTYSGYTFDDANSGTTNITIKKATTLDHGTDTGWVFTYGDGQAVFTDSLNFATNYWIWDGAVSPATPLSAGADNPLNYGFSVSDASACSATREALTVSSNNILRNFAITNVCGEGTSTTCQFGVHLSNGPTNNVLLSHFYAENLITDVQGPSGGGVNNLVVEHHHSKGAWSTDSCHGEVYATGGSNNTFRYNYLDQCKGTACIASNGPQMNDYKIYGNVMNKVSNNAPGVYGCGGGGNGAIAGAGASGIFNNADIHNNVIIQPGMCYGWFYDNGGVNNRAYNNIIRYQCGFNSGSPLHDNNYYLDCLSSAPSETNSIVSSVDPFVNIVANDFRLKSTSSAINSGRNLSLLYSYDMNGNTRGADGTWDIGAYEFNSGGSTPINGVCSLTLNTCTTGTLNDIADNSTAYLWQCVGLNGGTTASCSQVIPTSSPSITTQPISANAYTGFTASFSVVANGNPSVSYQWQKLNGATWTNVGTNSASFTTASLTLSDSGSQYRVNVSSSLGSVLSSVVTLTVTTAPPVPVNGLVAYYNFDNNVLNQMGGGFDGTITGNPTYTTGAINNSINLDGNDYISIGDLDVNPLTVSFWFNANTIPASGGFASIVMKAYTYGIEFSGNTLNTQIGNGGNWAGALTDTGFSTSQWYHATMTYDGTNLRYYRNGVLSGTSAANLASSNQVLRFGSWDGNSEYFNGRLDEVRIYNRALNASEINALYVYNGTVSIVDNFIYHPADNNPQNKIISTNEISSYISNYFSGSVSLTGSLYALTLLQQGGSYRNTSISSGCDTSPWNCWISSASSVPSDTTPPSVTASPLNGATVTSSSATLSVTTNEAATCRYSTTDTTYLSMAQFLTTGGTSHTQDLTSLTNGSYNYYIKCSDSSGNIMLSSSAVSFSVSLSGTLSCSASNVLCVDDTSGTTQEYSNIQSAVNAAISGSTVLVYPGSYSGTITVSSSGTLQSPINIQSQTKGGAVLTGGIIANGNYISIDGFTITNNGVSGGISINGIGTKITNNYLYNLNGWPIDLGGNNGYIGNNSIYHSTNGIIVNANNFLIENNKIERLYYYGGDDNDYVRFWGTNGTFRGNIFNGTILEVETNGPPSTGSHVDCFQTYIISGNSNDVVRNITFEKNYCADSHTSIIARDITQTGTGSHLSDFTIKNNVFVNLDNAVIVLHAANNAKIYNNVIAILKPTNIQYVIWFQGTDDPDAGSPTNGEVRNNIVYDSAGVMQSWSMGAGQGSIMTFSNNLYYGFVPNRRGVTDITGQNPLFVNANIGNFRLQTGSPAINGGISLAGMVNEDKDGVSRPQGSAYDIGAYERS